MNELTVNDLVTETPTTKRESRFGVIPAYPRIMDDLGISIDHTDIQGKLRESGVYKQLHEKLLLPASYSIYGVFFKPWEYGWLICVESPDLPEVPQNQEAPVITPMYRRNEDGTVHLVSIKIEDRWKRTYDPGKLTFEQV